MMLIQKFGSITVEQLQNEFKVSAITLRRDLQYWEDRDAIIRYHGGAKIIQHMVNHDNTAFTNDRYINTLLRNMSLQLLMKMILFLLIQVRPLF